MPPQFHIGGHAPPTVISYFRPWLTPMFGKSVETSTPIIWHFEAKFWVQSGPKFCSSPFIFKNYRHNIGVLEIFGENFDKSGLKCNKIQYWPKILDSQKNFRIALVNRPENRFLGGH